MAEKKKTGIRVNELAKELGVESKAILAKLKDEGLADAAPNHMSRIQLGLAESVREWFAESGSGGGTAVETAPPPAAVKAKRSTRKKQADGSESDEGSHDNSFISDDEPVMRETRAPVAEAPAEPSEASPITSAPSPEVGLSPSAAPLAPAASPAISAPPDAPTTTGPAVAAEAPQPTPATPSATESPAPTAMPASPTAAPVAPPAGASGAAGQALRPGALQPPKLRETITLANRSTITQMERKPITPAPQLLKPTAAVIQGPRVVREEKPDVVAAPRPRRPMNDSPQPGYTTARPTTGRGVKVDDEEEEKKKAANKKNSSLSTRRRGPDGRRGEADEKLREFTEADLIARRDALNAASATRRNFDRHLTKVEQRGTHAQAKSAIQKGEPIQLEEPITIKTLSAALGVKGNDIQSKLVKQGIFATVNQALDTEVASMIALEYGLELTTKAKATLEEKLLSEFESATEATDAVKMLARPPVVTILGHVDHGKTSLLDKIRKANVAAGEAGGITQHTAAWMVEMPGEDGAKKRVTFIDTPGHHAFTGMRARGANMTDVVVLVVGAVEGVMPQTIESINHARAAGVPIVVAMNKIDRPDSQPDMVLGQLAGQGLNPVEWGGDTEVIRTSATTGQGIEDLIETLDLQSQLLDLKADPNAPARGIVIESRIDAGLGPIATVLVQDGTLKLGDVMLSGPGYGRIRQLLNDLGKPIKEAGPSTPVIVSGLGVLPSAGDKFFIVDDVERARSIAEERANLSRMNELAGQNRITADNLLATIKLGDVQTINLIIKADVQGSVETLTKSVTDQNTEEVKVRVIHSGVGAVNESDVQLAMATKAKPTDNRVAIIGFHVTVEDAARQLSEQNHVDVKLYRVIYEIFDDLKKALSGMLTPEEREKLHGHAEVRQIFKVSRIGNIAGCIVTDGHIQRGSKIRVIRGGTIILEDLTIDTLRRAKDDVKEVKNGFECGIKLANFDDIKIGDRFEAYIRETFERTL